MADSISTKCRDPADAARAARALVLADAGSSLLIDALFQHVTVLVLRSIPGDPDADGRCTNRSVVLRSAPLIFNLATSTYYQDQTFSISTRSP